MVQVVVRELATLRVCPMLRVTDARAVGVLEVMADFVTVGVARIVPVGRGLAVPLFDFVVLAVIVPLALVDRVDRRVRVVVPDALDVFDAEILPVPVEVPFKERVTAALDVMVGLAEEVREARIVAEPLTLTVELLDADVLLDTDGLLLAVLEDVIDPLLVFDLAADLVNIFVAVLLGVI